MTNRRIRQFLMFSIIITLISLFIPFSYAEKYSFEKAEELTPLIEWREYNQNAFDEAIKENKPIFLLLTAPSWCYWCQVYESEDYLFNQEVVEYINKYSIPIYVDADKRHDLTRQYLEGGWPSTTIMDPVGVRLTGFSGARPASQIVGELNKAVNYVNGGSFEFVSEYQYENITINIPTNDQLNTLLNIYANYIVNTYDQEYGGFGTGQKFPQGRTLDFSLDLYEKTSNPLWLEIVTNTVANQYTNLDNIETDYNLFDPVEGGFHRYGTTRTWFPPHYEKMLYDNSRLLKTYYHLIQILPENLIALEMVNKTIEYMLINWYDEDGGFWGNTDVNGEEQYYGLIERPIPKARVEKTKYTNWNAEAIITFLYLYETSRDEKYKNISSKSLDFYAEEMINEEGMYHFKKDDEKAIQGNLLDNSYMLLAFVEGYETLGDTRYLDVGTKLARYSLNNFFDWKSGGFFERNSKDIESYINGEHIRLTKPVEENGIMAFSLLKLYSITGEKDFLYTGIKTMSYTSERMSGLDSSYYVVESFKYAIDKGLIEKYNEKDFFEYDGKEFWLDDLLNGKNNKNNFDGTDIDSPQTNIPVLVFVIIALLAGFLSFISPCTLPILPTYVAYSLNSRGKNIVSMTISFFLGLSLVFTILGMGASFIGNLIKSNIFISITGVAIILFGLYIILGKGFMGLKMKTKKVKGYYGSFFLGFLFGISWTPCIGPILSTMLILASTTDHLFGGFLLFLYSLGLGIPLFIVSIYLERINRNSKIWKLIQGKQIKIFGKEMNSNSLIAGILFVVIGYLIFSGSLISLNKFAITGPLQHWIYTIEEYLLNFIG